MNWRVIVAVIRVELIRSRKVLLWGVGPTVLAFIAVLVLEGAATKWAGLVIGLMLFATTMLAPVSSLVQEKMLGTLELDRTLPVPIRLLAAARLIAAALRTLPVVLLPASLAVIFARESAAVSNTTLAFGVGALQLLYWSAMWIGYGLISRFDFKKLVWLPAILWSAMILTPRSVLAKVKDYLVPRLTELVTAAIADPAKLPPVGLVLLALAVTSFAIAVLLLSSGLKRYVPNPMALQAPMEKVPREELVARGRGALLAQTRLRLRLAAPQIRREMIFVAVMVAVLVADSLGVSSLSALPDISRAYLPVLGLMMPMAIAIQLIAARSLGSLEGLQQLPHPRHEIALGHLLAIATLAIPGAIIWSIARAFEGPPVDPARLLSLACAVTAGGWLMASLAVWGTVRRMLILGAAAIGTPLLLIYGGGWLMESLSIDVGARLAPLFSYWEREREWLKPASVTALSAIVTAVSTLFFSHGLKTLQPKRS